MTVGVVQVAAVVAFMAAVRNVWLLALDVAPYIASVATAVSALTALFAFVVSRKTARRTQGVDAIRVAQSALVETIDSLREENDHLRAGQDRLRNENRALREQIRQLGERLEECRGWVNQIRRGP